MTELRFSHAYLNHAITHMEWIEFHAEAALFWAEHAELKHVYDGRQSSGGDQRLAKRGSLGSKYIGEDA